MKSFIIVPNGTRIISLENDKKVHELLDMKQAILVNNNPLIIRLISKKTHAR